jgi:hypothetical protein
MVESQAPTAVETNGRTTGTWHLNDAWSRDVGMHWRWILGALAVGCFLAGWLALLFDPDLPMHLRTGEWIVREGRVPFVEPFAWTRQGAPFFAYSWLPEVLYFWLLDAFGENGLHALHASIAASSFLVIIWLGRTARWTPWSTLLLALLCFAVWTAFISATRPQAWMAFTVPLAWIGAEYLARGAVGKGVMLTLLAAALTVNSHLLFPVTMVPVVRLLAEEQINWRRVMYFGVANVVGWLMTPYLLHLPQILLLNLTGNALVGALSPISELEPGFRALMHAAFSLKLASLILLLTPVFLPARFLTARERIWYLLAWTAGLGLFAIALRGLVIWLLVALPLLARLVAAIPLPTMTMTRRITVGATLIIPLSLAGGQLRARQQLPVAVSNVETRQLPMAPSVVLEPLVRWVECLSPRPSNARTYTVFDFGSYLVWRAPFLSYSIDGRGIFPDSVAKAEAMQLTADGPWLLGPWRSADLAIVPTSHAAAHALDADSAFSRVRTSVPTDSAWGKAALWARNSWLRQRQPVSVADTVRPARIVTPPGSC